MVSTQINKAYGTDWAKSKSRDLVRDMIERNLLDRKKPSQLYVLCFPGVDAAEIHEVYDRVGIPRRNIWGIERDPEVADELRRKNLGIRLYEGDIGDFVDSQRGLALDVVSLDYAGPISSKILKSAGKIARRNYSDKLVFHQANLLRRDIKGTAHIYAGCLGSDGGCLGSSKERVAYVKGDLPKGDIKSIKEKFVSVGTLAALFGGDLDIHSDIKLLRFATGLSKDEIAERFRQIVDRDFVSDMVLNESSLEELCMRANGILLSNGSKLLDEVSKIMIKDSLYEALRGATSFLRARTGADPDFKELISSMYKVLKEGLTGVFYSPLDFQRYSYVSESGSPMMGDIFYLEKSRGYAEMAGKFARTLGFPGKLINNKEQWARAISVYERARRKLQNSSMSHIDPLSIVDSERQFLGSSARPVLTKVKAIEEFKNGASVDEVRQKYRGVNGKPLAQWKAHVTMGTYNEQPRDIREVVQEDVEDSELEKITKEEAIDLLQSGIPPKEIYGVYPTSFSVGQLAAFKAHITMGRY